MKQLNNTKKPFVSAIMPVYNAGEFLVESIESILNQTYQNFEFIIIDDASTDNSWEIISGYAKQNKKIKAYKNQTNLGISATVQRAISLSKGKILARMDADDISLPDRFEKQVKHLQKNKKTVAVGAQCHIIDKAGNIIGRKQFPLSFDKIYRYIFRFIPLQQPTLMIAKYKLPKDFQYYADGMNTAEEVELLFKLFTYGKVENLPQQLLLYRLHGKNNSLADLRKTFLLTLIARVKAIFKYNYKPDAIGIIFTVVQTVIVLILPQKLTLFMYKMVRKMPLGKFSPITSLKRFSPTLPTTQSV